MRVIPWSSFVVVSALVAPGIARAEEPPDPSDAVESELEAEPHAHTLVVGGYIQPQLKLRQDDPAVRLEAADVERIATAAQAVLGAEWRRVKRGD